MDSFRTEIQLPRADMSLDHHQMIFSIGSCFAEHMHTKFKSACFKSFCNPCGIVYNPFSIAHQLTRLLDQRPWTQDDLVFDQGIYHGLHHHGAFSGADMRQTLEVMNANSIAAKAHLKTSDCLLITFGSAIVYTLEDNNLIVANCHTLPAARFEKRLLSVDEIVASSRSWIDAFLALNPKANLITTISPVRYLQSGFLDNTRSKARLALALEQLCKVYPQVHYFPAYEILLDDLRDYRFYKDDMIHPSEQAIEYIWTQFMQTYFRKETILLIDQLKKIRNGLEHRPLRPGSPAFLKFKEQLSLQVQTFKKEYPQIHLDPDFFV